jgi:hypothetical protein
MAQIIVGVNKQFIGQRRVCRHLPEVPRRRPDPENLCDIHYAARGRRVHSTTTRMG